MDSLPQRSHLQSLIDAKDQQRASMERLIASLDRDGLLELIMLAEARLAELEEEQDGQEPSGMSSRTGPANGKAGGAGWIELKWIPGANGKQYGPYAYKRWRQGKTIRSQYLGKVKQQEQ